MQLLEFILHIDTHLGVWTQNYGSLVYLILFIILFAETGLVVTPLLPGDSLLFAVGALTTLGDGDGADGLDFTFLSALLILAVFLGDNTNYFFGKWLGPKIFKNDRSKILNPKYLLQTEKFFLKYGEKAVILARFMPIVRTFVPFVAGIGKMRYPKFLAYSLAGSVLWIQSFLWLGRKFGNLPQVKSNFHLVIIAVVAISLMPMLIAWIKSKKDSKR